MTLPRQPTVETQPSWQQVLRQGIFPQFTDEMLAVVREALEKAS